MSWLLFLVGVLAGVLLLLLADTHYGVLRRREVGQPTAVAPANDPQLAQLRERAQQQFAALRTKAEEVEALQAENDALAAQVAGLEQEWQTAVADLAQARDNLDRVSAYADELTASHERLERQQQETQQTLSTARTRLTQAEQALTQLRGEQDQTSQQLQKARLDLQQRQQQLAESSHRVEEIAPLQAQNETLNRSLAAAQTQLAGLKTQLAAAEETGAELEQVQRQLAQTQAQATSAQAAGKALQEKVAVLQQQLGEAESLRRQLLLARQNLDDARARIGQLKLLVGRGGGETAVPPPPRKDNLTVVQGLDATSAKKLTEADIYTLAALAGLTPPALAQLVGQPEAQVAGWITGTQELVLAFSQPEASP